jgi:hypothetical protein
MFRMVIGVIVGIVTAIVLTLVLPQAFGSGVVRYTTLLFGGGVAGFICRKQGWLFGGLVGLIVTGIVAGILVDISLEGSGGRVASTSEMELVGLVVAGIVTGSLAGFVGQQLQRRFLKGDPT